MVPGVPGARAAGSRRHAAVVEDLALQEQDEPPAILPPGWARLVVGGREELPAVARVLDRPLAVCVLQDDRVPTIRPCPADQVDDVAQKVMGLRRVPS